MISQKAYVVPVRKRFRISQITPNGICGHDFIVLRIAPAFLAEGEEKIVKDLKGWFAEMQNNGFLVQLLTE